MPRKSLFVAMAKLHSVLQAITEDLGVSNLKSSELDVLAAAIEIASVSPKGLVSAKQILDHASTKNLGRSTVYRTISALEKQGLLVVNGPGYSAGYSVNFDLK